MTHPVRMEVLATDGALAPWSELADNVISPLVRNFVSKQ